DRLGRGFHPRVAEAAVGEGERALDDGADVLLAERVEHVDAGAGEQRGVECEGRIFRRRPDQDDRSSLHVGEEGVLLRLVEAVDLVDEEDGLPALADAALLGLGDDLAHVGHAPQHCREGDECASRRVGDHPRQRRLARAGRAPEDHGRDFVALDRLAEEPALAEQVLLTEDLVERAGAHPLRKGEGAVLEKLLLTRIGRHGAHDSRFPVPGGCATFGVLPCARLSPCTPRSTASASWRDTTTLPRMRARWSSASGCAIAAARSSPRTAWTIGGWPPGNSPRKRSRTTSTCWSSSVATAP